MFCGYLSRAFHGVSTGFTSCLVSTMPHWLVASFSIASGVEVDLSFFHTWIS